MLCENKSIVGGENKNLKKKKKIQHTTKCCSLSITTHGEKMHKEIIWVLNRRFWIAVFWRIGNQKPMVNNHNKSFMHFLIMSCNEQLMVGMDEFSCSASAPSKAP